MKKHNLFHRKSSRAAAVAILVLLLLIAAGAAVMGNIWYDERMSEKEPQKESQESSRDESGVPLNVYGEEIKTPDGTLEYNNTVMAENGKLFRTSDIEYVFDEETEDKNASDIIDILNAVKDEYPVLYVQRPSKYDKKTDVLPYGYSINIHDRYDYWCERMRDAGIPVLDLRKVNRKHNEFYYGDHHWTIETAYRAAKLIENRLEKEYGDRFEYDSKLYERSNYRDLTRGGFVGEEARRSDMLFMGAEDITFLIPEFDTEYEFFKYSDGELLLHTSGKFEEALMDQERLNAEETGKYNVCLYWTANEARIYNHSSKNDQKILLVANSLGRALAMYLSLGFSETRYIDPQQDRFNESIIEYTKEYDPDFVVVMFNQSVKMK